MMKSLYINGIIIAATCCISVPAAVNGQVSAPRVAGAVAEVAISKPKIIERVAKVTRVDKASFDAVDSEGKKYTVPLAGDAPPPQPNAKIKIKITISIRPPGGSVEISW